MCHTHTPSPNTPCCCLLCPSHHKNKTITGSALQRPDLLGDASERSDIRYNAACAAALAGQFEITQQLIQGLAAAGMLDVGEMAGDEDLASVRGLPWFVQLVQ